MFSSNLPFFAFLGFCVESSKNSNQSYPGLDIL